MWVDYVFIKISIFRPLEIAIDASKSIDFLLKFQRKIGKTFFTYILCKILALKVESSEK